MPSGHYALRPSPLLPLADPPSRMDRTDDLQQQSLRLHEDVRGKISVGNKLPLVTREDLSLAYTPGVAEPCRAIARDPSLAGKLTLKSNAVAVVSVERRLPLRSHRSCIAGKRPGDSSRTFK